MPELPDIVVYIEALQQRVQGQTLQTVRLTSPFLLRTALPPLERSEGKKVLSITRLGKRIVFGLETDLFLVLHLMIAGRLHWAPAGGKAKPKPGLATFEFSSGNLTLTEAGSKRRASLHLLQGADALAALDPGGLEVFGATAQDFMARLRSANHTLKRALTDPRLFSGIGNAYSDEILFEAKLSPATLTFKLADDECLRLFAATTQILQAWTELLRCEANDKFPEKVTAFRPEMKVHGRYGLPCPRCSTPIQRIRYADNETNYCPHCQTGGKLLSDRALSRLLGRDWPKSIEALESLTARHKG